VPICASRRKNRVLTTPLDSIILRRCAKRGYTVGLSGCLRLVSERVGAIPPMTQKAARFPW